MKKQINVLIDVGEFGWTISKVGPFYRKYSQKNPVHVMCYKDRVSLYSDFSKSIIHFPDWINQFSPNCYTLDGFSKNHLDKLKKICYNHFDTEDINFLIPYQIFGHCNKNIAKKDREFIVYKASKKHRKLIKEILPDKPNIVIWPRFRQGSRVLSGRNWSEHNWNNLLHLFINDKRFQNYNIFLLGINRMSSLKGISNTGNLYNFISYIEEDYVGFCIGILENSTLSISSQSGGLILSLHCKVPVISWGQEKYRHMVEENIWNVQNEFFDCAIGNYDSVKPEQIYKKTIEMLGG